MIRLKAQGTKRLHVFERKRSKVFWPNRLLNNSTGCLPFICLALFAGLSEATASDGPFFSTGELKFSVDVSQFEGEADLNIVEVVFAMNLSDLYITSNDSISFDVDLEILASSPGYSRNISEHHSAGISDRAAPGEFVDLKRFDIPPAEFSVNLMIKDSFTGKAGVVEHSFEYKDLASSLSISDYVFISHLSKGEPSSQLSRHGLIMVPNPSRRFNPDQGQAKAYIYYEINNLDAPDDSVATYDISYIVRNSYGTPVLNASIPDLERTVSDVSRVENIPLVGLTPGTYYFALNVTSAGGNTATATQSFQIADRSPSASPVESMTDDDFMQSYEIIRQLVAAKELRRYKKLSREGKQEFLKRFWESKDPTPSTTTNEYRIELYKRYNYCANQFQGGISTGRGRVYFKYGQPVDVERQFSAIDLSRPTEIWTYAQNGRTEFVFVDRSRDGSYVLVHSNHRDEINNPDWRRELQGGN